MRNGSTPRFFHHIPLADTRGLFNELDAGVLQRPMGASGNVCGIPRILNIRIAVEGFHQFSVGDGVGRLIQTRAD